MKKVLAALVFGMSFLSVSQVNAQETPDMQLEFARRLRAKGYNDLALEQLEKLRKLANPALASVVQLEQARTMLAAAREKDADQRPPLFSAARAELEAFVKKYPSGPEGAQGRLELARLVAYLGQSLLTRALRDEDVALARKAEQQFIQAGKELEQAAKVLEDQATNYKDTDSTKQELVRKQLSQDFLQARLDRASNFIDQALTYINTASDVDNRKRAEVVDQAKKAFKAIAADGGPVGLMASAWLVKVNQEGQDPTEAEKHRKRVMDQKGKDAQPAQRLARRFYIQGILKNPTLKLDTMKKYKLILNEGKKWLVAYPGFAKTSDGLAVRFEMAQAMYLEGQALSKDSKSAPPASVKALYDQAQKHLLVIGESDDPLGEKAKALNVRISVLKMGEKTAVTDLMDFQDCYLKAQVEMYNLKHIAGELAKAAPKDKDKLEAERKKQMRAVLQALTRAILLSDAKTPSQSLDEARFLLATGYLISGDLYRAAVAGEALGKSRPPSKRSGQAAAYAIEAYANIVQRDNAVANRQHLNDLTNYVLSPAMQKTWANEPVTAVAHYQLAMLHYKDSQYKQALAELSKLTPDFNGYLYAQGQLVFIALDAKDKAKTDAEKKAYADLARAAILRMPALGADADPTTAAMYYNAQLKLAEFYYADAYAAVEKNNLPLAEKTYQTMDQLVNGLKAKLEKSSVTLADETRHQIDYYMGALTKYARLGLSEVDYRKGNYDLVLKNTDSVVADLASKKRDDKIRLKDFQLTGDLLGLALRANVQKGNVAKAKEILGYLERLAGEEGDAVVETSNVLRSLIGDLQVQIKELKKANKSAELQQTIKNFSAFIDDLAEKKGQELSTKDTTFLANCYSSLEQYAKAAELYAKIPPPKSLDQDKLDEKEEKDIGTYCYMQIQYAKALRHSAKTKEDLEKARKLLSALQKHKNVRMQIYIEVEQIHNLEDNGSVGNPLYGAAQKAWAKIMSNSTLKARMGDDPSLKELYFNAYYGNAWCLFKASQTEKIIAAKKEKIYLKAAANHIIRLERTPDQEGWQIVGPKFQELLSNEKKLRDEYEQLKKITK